MLGRRLFEVLKWASALGVLSVVALVTFICLNPGTLPQLVDDHRTVGGPIPAPRLACRGAAVTPRLYLDMGRDGLSGSQV